MDSSSDVTKDCDAADVALPEMLDDPTLDRYRPLLIVSSGLADRLLASAADATGTAALTDDATARRVGQSASRHDFPYAAWTAATAANA